MKIHLAALSQTPYIECEKCIYALESFYYFEKWQAPYLKTWDFLLDSGAFTFMSTRKNVDLEIYLTKYIEFINEHNIEKFFELDVDNVKGLHWVEQARARLERETGKKCIPVWHKARGKEYFVDICREYDYVAVGGIVTGEIRKSDYKYFSELIKIAHENRAKIHGLGLTNMQALHKYPFDSVDSTNWKSGGRFGQLHLFNNNTGEIKIHRKPNTRAKDYKEIDKFNFEQWCKFQKYAERYM